MELVRESELVKTHVFKYSVRRGTRAAGMTDQVDEKIKNRRSKVLIEVAEEVQRKFLEKCRGTVRRVLFEQEEDGMVTGYTDNYIKVYVPADSGPLAPECGKFAFVEIGDLYLDGVTGTVCQSVFP